MFRILFGKYLCWSYHNQPTKCVYVDICIISSIACIITIALFVCHSESLRVLPWGIYSISVE